MQAGPTRDGRCNLAECADVHLAGGDLEQGVVSLGLEPRVTKIVYREHRRQTSITK